MVPPDISVMLVPSVVRGWSRLFQRVATKAMTIYTPDSTPFGVISV